VRNRVDDELAQRFSVILVDVLTAQPVTKRRAGAQIAPQEDVESIESRRSSAIVAGSAFVFVEPSRTYTPFSGP